MSSSAELPSRQPACLPACMMAAWQSQDAAGLLTHKPCTWHRTTSSGIQNVLGGLLVSVIFLGAAAVLLQLAASYRRCAC